VIIYTMGVRETDLPQPAPENPFRHLEEVKTRIYENLRDLQFEYRLGKLSDADYQSSKLSVQKELGQVLGEIDVVKQRLLAEGKMVANTPPSAKRKAAASYVCPHCKASFKEPLKFCGECGKAMAG
jgi:rRNA maturation endonuclease Nob1